VSVSNFASNAKLAFKSVDEAFPKVDAGHLPLGERVMVQIRKTVQKTSGGIFIPEESRKTEHDNTQIAKIIAVGPLAFCNRDTGEKWPEGEWAKVGDFVRCPKYGGDRWEVSDKDGDAIIVAIFKDTDLLAKVTADPRNVRAFI
jgi:co-chaperonin GroES (HSP10)